MKLCVVLLHVAAILSIAGYTLSDEIVGCPITEGNEANKITGMLKDGLHECFGNVGGLDLKILKNEREPGSRSWPRLVEFCGREDLIKECIKTVTTRYSACLGESQPNQFVLLEEFLKSTFSFGCLGDSVTLKIVINYMFSKDNSTAESNDFTDCMAVASRIEVDGSMIGFYREFKVFKECFIGRMRLVDTAVIGAEIMLNGIMRSMKCQNPDDASEVLCGTIETSSTTEERCPFDVYDATHFETFFVYGAQCLAVNLNRLDLDHLREFTTIQEYQTYFNVYCQNRPLMVNCLGDVSSDSKLCQSELFHRLFTIVADFFGSSVEIVCEQNGGNLATIFNGVFNNADQAVGNDTIKLCMEPFRDSVRIFIQSSESQATRPALAYNSLKTLKECILDDSSDVNSFKTVFDSLSNEILGTVKCIHPDDGTDVLCKTLS